MRKMLPPDYLSEEPCSVVAVICALKDLTGKETPLCLPNLKSDGYATLEDANRFIRRNLSVKKRTDYKRGERPLLKELNLENPAVVCVYGHFLYVNKGSYWSFFDNEGDEVVAVWELKG